MKTTLIALAAVLVAGCATVPGPRETTRLDAVTLYTEISERVADPRHWYALSTGERAAWLAREGRLYAMAMGDAPSSATDWLLEAAVDFGIDDLVWEQGRPRPPDDEILAALDASAAHLHWHHLRNHR